MKASHRFCLLGLLVVLVPAALQGALSRQTNLLGKFLVTKVNGTVTCVSEGRVVELKKGDAITARGAIVETAAKASAVLVFSNGTGVYTDELTRFEVEKFDQEFFAPNNNLRVEPSNSATVVRLNAGRVVICTPRLLSGTTMVYETRHASIGIRGEKIVIETEDNHTHIALLAGTATVNPRDPDGNFVSIGKRLVTGQEAIVKYTLAGRAEDEAEVLAAPSPAKLAPPTSTPASVVIAKAPGPAQTPAAGLSTIEGAATAVYLTGTVQAKVPGTQAAFALTKNTKLPRGSVVSTGPDAEVYLEVYSGAIATLQPNSVVEIEQLATTTDSGVLKKQSAVLQLKSGLLISTIDPAKRDVNEYAVRSSQGLASAHGTAFSTSLQADGFSVAATADTVAFLTLSGTSYEIAAGNVSVTPPAGQPQPPIPLAAAAAAHPQFAAIVLTALSTTAAIVENNLGSLSAASAANLLTKVAATAANALPDQAPAIAARVVAAVSSPFASTAANAGAAAAAVTQAVVTAAPSQAAAIAAAAATASQAHEATVSAAAAKSSPPQAAQITAAVAQGLVWSDRGAAVTPARVQSVAAVAGAVTTSIPSQAAPVAAAAAQALMQAEPGWSAPQQAQNAAVVAAVVTAGAPVQAAPVTVATMKLLLQPSLEATPHMVAQVGGVIAGAVISVVQPRSGEVAMAAMQLIVQSYPRAVPGWIADTAGILAATLSQLFPAQAPAIVAGIAAGSNLSIAAVEESASRFSIESSALVHEVGVLTDLAFDADRRSRAARNAVASGQDLATAANGPIPGFPSGNLAGRGRNNVSISITTGTTDSSTSIVIMQFDPTAVNQLTADIEAAQFAQSSVQFNTEPTAEGGVSVRPFPTVPQTLPADRVVSSAHN